MFTIRGCADWRSAGRKAFVTPTTPNTFVSYTQRKLSTVSLSGVLSSSEMPALLTRMSRAGTWFAAAAMLAASVTSSTSGLVPPPISATARSPRPASRDAA